MTDPTAHTAAIALKEALAARDPLTGTFIRTAATSTVEIVGGSGLDFACLDAEHGVFGRRELDHCLLAARAVGLACLVRVPALDPVPIGQVLDMGGAGVVVPHVRGLADAERLARIAHFGPGGRGFASSPRATGYGGRSLQGHVDAARRETVVIGMLEDPEAFDEVDAMMAVPGIDGWILGYSDLTVALGAASKEDERITDATRKTAAAAETHGKSLIGVVGKPEQIAPLRDAGFTAFIVGSDQGFIRSAATAIAGAAKQDRK